MKKLDKVQWFMLGLSSCVVVAWGYALYLLA